MNAIVRMKSINLSFSSNSKHNTIIPIVFVYSTVWPPVEKFSRVFHKYFIRPDGFVETLHSFLLYDLMIAYRDPAGMDNKILERWPHRFVEQSMPIRNRYKYVVLNLYAYGAHVSFSTFNLLIENNIVSAAPAGAYLTLHSNSWL